MDYKRKIVEMLDKIHNEKYLEYLYKLIKSFLN